MPGPQNSGQSAVRRQNAGLTAALVSQSNTGRLWSYRTAQREPTFHKDHSSMHVAQAVLWSQGPAMAGSRVPFCQAPLSPGCDEWEVQLAGCPPAQHPLLILAPVPEACPSRRIQRTQGRACAHPACGVWNVNLCTFLCRTHKYFGCHPETQALPSVGSDLGYCQTWGS